MGFFDDLGRGINRTFINITKNVGDQISLPVRMINDASKGKDAWKTFTDTQKRQIGTDAYILHGGPVVQSLSKQITGNKTIDRMTGGWLKDAEDGLGIMNKFGREKITQAEWNVMGQNAVRGAAVTAAAFGGAALYGAYAGAASVGGAGLGAGVTSGTTIASTTAAAGATTAAAGTAAAAGGTSWLTTATGILGLASSVAKLAGGGGAQAPQQEQVGYLPDGYVPPGTTAGDFFGPGNYTTTAPALTGEQFAEGSKPMLVVGLIAAVGVAYIATRKK